jgi:cytidine deaminase
VAGEKSICTYSKFRVGAALLLDNGQTVLGSNQENAILQASERVAIFKPGLFILRQKKMAITAASDSNKTIAPIPPCGSCRQSIAEYETRQELNRNIFHGRNR